MYITFKPRHTYYLSIVHFIFLYILLSISYLNKHKYYKKKLKNQLKLRKKKCLTIRFDKRIKKMFHFPIYYLTIDKNILFINKLTFNISCSIGFGRRRSK